MGEQGILFLAGVPDVEGYMVDSNGTATLTRHDAAYRLLSYRLTIYRLTLYYLIALAGLGFALSLFGLVPARPEAIACTTAILFASCHGANAIFSRIWRVRSNPESSLITALILVLILEPVFPPASPRGALVIALAGAVGMASKYLLAIRRQHLFNPAAAAALFSGLVFGSFASWWVGGTYLLPLVMVGGALLARKVSRLRLVGVFLAEFLVIMTALSLINGLGPDMILQSTLFFVLGQSAVVFFAVVMLTEPMTSPNTLLPSSALCLSRGSPLPAAARHPRPQPDAG